MDLNLRFSSKKLGGFLLKVISGNFLKSAENIWTNAFFFIFVKSNSQVRKKGNFHTHLEYCFRKKITF